MTIFGKIILGALLISPFIGHAQDEEFIEWSPVKRLSWEDYLAKPSSASDAAAITSTALGLEYHVRNNVLTYKITCRFSRQSGTTISTRKNSRPTSTRYIKISWRKRKMCKITMISKQTSAATRKNKQSGLRK